MNELLHNFLSVTEPGFFAFIAAMLTVSLLAARIAKKKGYSGTMLLWVWVPVANIYGLIMFTGLPNLQTRAKADALAERLTLPSQATGLSLYPKNGE